MYRLTLANVKIPLSNAPKFHRVYRWGDAWGTLALDGAWDSVWQAERRSYVSSAQDQLLETITPIHISAPPTLVDDIWEEEYVSSTHITCGNVTTITGNKATILEIVGKYKITLDPSISESMKITVEDIVVLPLPKQQAQQPLQQKKLHPQRIHGHGQRQSHQQWHQGRQRQQYGDTRRDVPLQSRGLPTGAQQRSQYHASAPWKHSRSAPLLPTPAHNEKDRLHRD